jgi:hypothetical protein
VPDYLCQTAVAHLISHFLGGEGFLAGSTPDIDPPGVGYQDPGVDARQFPAQGVETQFVVGGDENGGLRVGTADAVQAGDNLVIAAAGSASGADSAEMIPPGQACANPRDLTGRGLDEARDIRFEPVTWTFMGP